MIESKPIKQIMKEYANLLIKYESQLNTLDIDDCKKIIGEIKLLWYRNHKYVNYFLEHISYEDDVYFLAGEVQLNITENGQYDFILVGHKRFINDPFLKLASYYKDDGENIDFEYMNNYFAECMQDLLTMFREYSEDFYVLPIEYIKTKDYEDYLLALKKSADKMILSMFSVKYNDIDQFIDDNNTYEDIEIKLLPFIKDILIFQDISDKKLCLRDKCNKNLENMKDMLYLNNCNEVQLFYLMISQYCIETIGILMIMLNYHMIPFIRDEVTFQYYTMLFCTDFIDELNEEIFLKTYIPYIIQSTYDFSKYDYQFIKEKLGNSKLINEIIDCFDSNTIPKPQDIEKCADNIMLLLFDINF